MSRQKKKHESGVCRACGCTWDNPCINGAGETCAWANKEQTLCTFCANKIKMFKVRTKGPYGIKGRIKK